MPSYYVTLSRKRQYTEEGVAFVVAKDQDGAIEQALLMVDGEEVDFHIDADGVTTAPSSLQVHTVEPAP